MQATATPKVSIAPVENSLRLPSPAKRGRGRGWGLLVALLVLCTPVTRAQETTGGIWALRAATARQKGSDSAVEVRLLWLPTKGWLPEGGFNLYRSETGKEGLVKLNPVPLNQQNLFTAAMQARLRSAPTGIAALEVTAPANRTIRLSSGAAFQQIRGTAQTLQSTPGLPPSMIRSRLAESPAVQNHLRTLSPTIGRTLVAPPRIPGVAPAPQTTADPVPNATEAEKVAALRSHALLQAVSDRAVALRLGIAFDDKTAKNGASYRYVLRGVGASGTEDPKNLVEFQMVVGADAQPPAPTVSGFQFDQGIADLHWEPPTDDQRKALLQTTYRVARVDSTHPGGDGLQVSTGPVIITYQPTSDGNSIPSPTTFRDKAAPLGSVTYRVTMLDAFGRESAPGTTTLTMNDLRMPAPVKAATAVLASDQKTVQVYYLASVDSDLTPALRFAVGQTPPLAYDLFRVDTEATTLRPVSLTESPAAGSPVSASALPATVLLDLFGEDTVRPLLTPERPAGGKTGETTKGAAFRAALLGKTVAQASQNIPPTLKTHLNQVLATIREYDDTTAMPDHFLRYRVAACFTANRRDTVAAETNIVPVPLLTPLSTPAAPTLHFAVVPNAAFGSYDKGSGKPRIPSSNGTLMTAPPPAPSSPSGTGPAPSTSGKMLGRSAQLGGTMTVSWQAVTPNNHVRYRVFRISATGLFPVSGGTPVGTNPQSRYAGIAKAGKPAPQFKQYYLDYPGATQFEFTLLGETDKTTWSDEIPRSFAVNYLYKIQAVSRWGVQSDMGTIAKVYTPATLPPSVPMLIASRATDDGYVQLTLHPNIVEEQITEYHVFRKAMDATVKVVEQTPVSATAYQVAANGAAGGKAAPFVPPISAPRPQMQATFNGKTLSGGAGKATAAGKVMGSAGLRFGVQRFTSPATLLSRGISVSNLKAGIRNSGKYNAPKLTPDEIARLIDIRTTTELHTPTDMTVTTTTGLITIVDQTAKPGTTYLYRVIALNRDGVGSSPSVPLDGKAIKVRANPPGSFRDTVNGVTSAVSLTWTVPDGGAGSYLLERALKPSTAAAATGAGNANAAALAAAVTAANGTVLTDNRPQAPVVTTGGGKTGTGKGKPRLPVGVSGGGGGTTPTTAPAASSTDNDPNYFPLGVLDSASGPPDTKYRDESTRPGRTYIYRLTATDSEGNISVPQMIEVTIARPGAPGAPPPVPQYVLVNPGNGKVTNPGRAAPTTVTPVVVAAGGGGGGGLASPKPSSRTAHFNEAYFLTGSRAFAVRVEKAAFRASGYAIDAQNYYYCRPSEKFLLLTLRVKNVTDQPQPFDYQTITAGVDAGDGTELSPTKNWKALDTNHLANRTVAPGEEMVVEGVVTVPAEGTPRTLSFGDCTYALGGDPNTVTPLPSAFGGGDILAAEIPAQIGTAYPLAYTDGTVASASNTGGNNFVVSLRVKNTTAAKLTLSPQNYTVEIFDGDGDAIPVEKGETAPVSLASGAETTLRFTYSVPKTNTVKTLKVRERDGRVYVFTLGEK